MIISWKKAESFVSTLSDISVPYELHGKIGAFTDVEAEVARVTGSIRQYIQRTQNINEAILTLKLALGQASYESGNHATLTKIAAVERELSELKSFIAAKRGYNVLRDIDGLKQLQASIAAGEGSERFRVMQPDILLEDVANLAENRCHELRRELASLKDVLLAKTAELVVDVPDNVVEILVAEGLV